MSSPGLLKRAPQAGLTETTEKCCLTIHSSEVGSLSLWLADAISSLCLLTWSSLGVCLSAAE